MITMMIIMKMIKIKIMNMKMMKNLRSTKKFKIIVITPGNLEDLKYKVPKNISIIIDNVGYDAHFIINQLAKEFQDEFDCIGENMEKYITFSIPIFKKNLIIVKKLHTN